MNERWQKHVTNAKVKKKIGKQNKIHNLGRTKVHRKNFDKNTPIINLKKLKQNLIILKFKMAE